MSSSTPPTHPSIRLICFDLGHVLVRICDSWQHAGEAAGLTVPIPALDESRQAALHDIIHAMEISRIDTDQFCADAARVLGIETEQMQKILHCHLLGVFPGVHELLEELISRGYRTACLSNTNAVHWRQMFDQTSHCALPGNRLTYRFASHEVRLRKPDEAIYAHVERVTELRGTEIVFFDDLPANVEAAKQRGWLAHQILPDRDPITQIREHLTHHNVLQKRG